MIQNLVRWECDITFNMIQQIEIYQAHIPENTVVNSHKRKSWGGRVFYKKKEFLLRIVKRLPKNEEQSHTHARTHVHIYIYTYTHTHPRPSRCLLLTVWGKWEKRGCPSSKMYITLPFYCNMPSDEMAIAYHLLSPSRFLTLWYFNLAQVTHLLDGQFQGN